MSVLNVIKDFAARGRYFVKAKSPELLFAGAVIAGGVCIYETVKGTLKAAPIIEDANAEIDRVEFMQTDAYKEWAERATTVKDPVDDPEAFKKKIVGKAAVDVAKCYIGALISGLAAIGMACGSFGIINKRYASAVGDALASRTLYNKLRKRIRDEHGEEAENKLVYGDNVKKTTVKNPETGEEEETFVPCMDEDTPLWVSRYSFEYENESYHPGFDLMQVRNEQEYWNRKLNEYGYLEANSIYTSMPGHKGETKGAWCGIGWLSKKWIDRLQSIDALPKDYPGDGYVSFGVLEGEGGGPQAAAWRDGQLKSVIMDLNVDGPIYKYIDIINNWDDVIAKRCGK